MSEYETILLTQQLPQGLEAAMKISQEYSKGQA
jgi:hypothetical protein